MSFATLEKAILVSTRVVVKNPKLKLADIQEWSTGDVKPEDDSEIVVRVADGLNVNVCIKKTCDKRV